MLLSAAWAALASLASPVLAVERVPMEDVSSYGVVAIDETTGDKSAYSRTATEIAPAESAGPEPTTATAQNSPSSGTICFAWTTRSPPHPPRSRPR